MLITRSDTVAQEGGLDVARLGLDLLKRKFANQRQWREFVSAVQCSVNYPAAINSLRSGTRWFSDGLAQASSCLVRTLRVAPRSR
jgi:hypothetical protein